MKTDKFYNELANLLELERNVIDESFNLKTMGLDSLILVSMVAIIDIEFGVRFHACEIELCETISDVLKSIELKKGQHEHVN